MWKNGENGKLGKKACNRPNYACPSDFADDTLQRKRITSSGVMDGLDMRGISWRGDSSRIGVPEMCHYIIDTEQGDSIQWKKDFQGSERMAGIGISETIRFCKEDILRDRPRLAENMDTMAGYVLHKELDGTWIVIIPKDNQLILAKDKPARSVRGIKVLDSLNGEKYEAISIPSVALQKLLDFVAEKTGMMLLPSECKSGRPPKYGIEDAKRILWQRKQGFSIREIAKKEKMSATTVQKLMGQYKGELIMEEMMKDEH